MNLIFKTIKLNYIIKNFYFNLYIQEIILNPLIAISSSWAPERKGRPEFPDPEIDYLKCQYSHKIADAGGIPIIVPNLEVSFLDDNYLKNFFARLDGLLLSGGIDINPAFYGDDKIHPDTKVSRRRDDVEMAILKFALFETKIPIFAICRGHQLLNVVCGGNLWQDITMFWKENFSRVIIEHRRIPDESGIKHRVWHKVRIFENTRLAEIIGKDEIVVNSSHHQFVKEIGKGLVVSARSPDGAVEALEMKDDRFILSVQWHPEAMVDEDSDRLFEAFVREAAKG
ncbi:gamma-glutamyl-gamma-aminobutyrate hydrolase family protein [bacterium]|nr:MAG: gamma-glutamyl-gamma-aminobutyrate hydrolase family protein [bacterium]